MAKILFMDGFDLHIPSGNNTGFYDVSAYWNEAPLWAGQEFVEGHLFGQGRVWNQLSLAGQSTAIPPVAYGYNSIPRNVRKKRVCFWARADRPATGGVTMAPFVTFGTFGIGLLINTSMQVEMVLDPGIRSRGAIGELGQKIPITDPAYSFIDSFRWHFCELILDLDIGQLIFMHEDTVILHVQLATLAPQWQEWLGFGTDYQDFIEALENRAQDLRFGAPPSPMVVYTDHVIVTDGDRPEPNRIHCVAPTAAWATLVGVGQLRGNLVVRGTSYPTQANSNIATAGYVFPDPNRPTEIAPITNLSNVQYFPYPVNPRTLAPWTSESLGEISGWGVCGARMYDPGDSRAGDFTQGQSIVLWSLGLSIVETMSDPRGYPVIRVEPPSALTYYNGYWQKSHPTRTISGHVSDIPRTTGAPGDGNPANRYLATNVNGCLLFDFTSSEREFDAIGLTFAEEKREDYRDWYDATGHDWPFSSYFITGYNVLGEGNKVFQSNYVTVNYVPVPQGSAYIQGVWDYAKNGNTGRWSSKQQIYSNSDTNYSNRMRKLKIRGQGVAMQMKVSSEDGKPFSINGWSTSASSNAGV